jgi:hypothetical protein
VLANASSIASSAMPHRTPRWSAPMGFAGCNLPANVTVARPSAISPALNQMRPATGTSLVLALVLKSFRQKYPAHSWLFRRPLDSLRADVPFEILLKMTAGQISRFLLRRRRVTIKLPSSVLTINVANSEESTSLRISPRRVSPYLAFPRKDSTLVSWSVRFLRGRLLANRASRE